MDGLIHAGKVEVGSIEQPRPEVVVGIVINTDEALSALGIGKEPGTKALLDEFLLLAGSQRGLLVDDALLAVAGSDRVVDHRSLMFKTPVPGARGRSHGSCRRWTWRQRRVQRRVGRNAPNGVLRRWPTWMAMAQPGRDRRQRPGCRSPESRAPEMGIDVPGEDVFSCTRLEGLRVSGIGRASLQGGASLARTLPERYTSAVCQVWPSGSWKTRSPSSAISSCSDLP